MKKKDFYGSLASIYDELFPYQPAQKAFVLKALKGIPSTGTILDVGCGTGSLIVDLAHHFALTYGMDPDQDMLDQAWVKVLSEAVATTFIPGGMLDIAANFGQNSLDGILCLGNTLVHLTDEDQVSEMLRQSIEALRPGGRFILQIINYDRILDQDLPGLPSIETPRLRFERHYDRIPGAEVLGFRTILHIAPEGRSIEHTVPLLALRPGRLLHLAGDAGFVQAEKFGGFDGSAFTDNSQPFILTMNKPF